MAPAIFEQLSTGTFNTDMVFAIDSEFSILLSDLGCVPGFTQDGSHNRIERVVRIPILRL